MDATLMIVWAGVLLAAIVLILRAPGRVGDPGAPFPDASPFDVPDDLPDDDPGDE